MSINYPSANIHKTLSTVTGQAEEAKARGGKEEKKKKNNKLRRRKRSKAGQWFRSSREITADQGGSGQEA